MSGVSSPPGEGTAAQSWSPLERLLGHTPDLAAMPPSGHCYLARSTPVPVLTCTGECYRQILPTPSPVDPYKVNSQSWLSCAVVDTERTSKYSGSDLVEPSTPLPVLSPVPALLLTHMYSGCSQGALSGSL